MGVQSVMQIDTRYILNPKSKTHVFNWIAGIFLAMEQNSALLENVLAPEDYKWVVLLVVIGNVAIRNVTKQGITEK